jgi:putative alpha-1,2-mannosidase
MLHHNSSELHPPWNLQASSKLKPSNLTNHDSSIETQIGEKNRYTRAAFFRNATDYGWPTYRLCFPLIPSITAGELPKLLSSLINWSEFTKLLPYAGSRQITAFPNWALSPISARMVIRKI